MSHRSENFGFRCCPLIIITSMPMFATCRVKVEQIIFFVIIKNRYSKRKECFSAAPVLKFWKRFCENQGCKNFVHGSCSFKAYCKLHRLAFVLDVVDLMWWMILEYQASEKFVLASESNLPLATGLASWKVSLEPWKWFGIQPHLVFITHTVHCTCTKKFWKQLPLLLLELEAFWACYIWGL